MKRPYGDGETRATKGRPYGDGDARATDGRPYTAVILSAAKDLFPAGDRTRDEKRAGTSPAPTAHLVAPTIGRQRRRSVPGDARRYGDEGTAGRS